MLGRLETCLHKPRQQQQQQQQVRSVVTIHEFFSSLFSQLWEVERLHFSCLGADLQHLHPHSYIRTVAQFNNNNKLIGSPLLALTVMRGGKMAFLTLLDLLREKRELQTSCDTNQENDDQHFP